MGGGEGKEGDWECGGCENRNYAFRSFCNRCKQPRLLVDSKTPADSKWLPRIGDWICNGCTNNNYASREKCKKCGQPKEVAALPPLGASSLQIRPQFYQQQRAFPVNPNWLLGGPMGPTNTAPFANQVVAPKGWRNGDWICTCGFHNYSSRAQCKKCNASMPPALGTKRLASEDLVQDWDNKRLNAGQTFGVQHAYGQISSSSFLTPFQMLNSATNETAGIFQLYPDITSTRLQHSQLNLQLPTLPGKGAKQWRDGDWMCTNCNNHNYASRSHCNKCDTQREGPAIPVTVA